ncbi:MAG: hypothetical protein IJT28_02745 [Bacteroidaceae bacterium]|nr:hypothetical protein [Bacteroidaceae bacterium]
MTRSETEPTPNTFPSREQILANQTVLAHMQELWNLTKNDANESEKRERGCYILYYGGQDYRFVDKEGGWYPSTSSSHLYWSVETELTNDEKTRLCAFFHTHTTMQYVSSDSARKVGPSGRDTSISMASYLPGFVYDYCGDNDTINSPYGFVWGNTSTDADAKIYEFGQNTRLPH